MSIEIKKLDGQIIKTIDVDSLRGAYLRGADLRGAYLRDADLRGACLGGAYLRGADLRGAYLRGADLRGAYLRGADLRDADLRDADLRDADLRGACLPYFSIVPERGSFIAFKKLCGNIIATLEVPSEAKRTSSLVSRKCRAEWVKVLELSGGIYEGKSVYDATIRYKVGDIVQPDSYYDDIRTDCSHGIHFFITRSEAEDYCI